MPCHQKFGERRAQIQTQPSFCDPVSFVASFWQRLRHTRRTFVSTWPKPNIVPGALYDMYVNSFAIAIR